MFRSSSSSRGNRSRSSSHATNYGLDIEGTSFGSALSTKPKRSAPTMVEQLEKTLAIKEEFESIEMRVKILLDEFEEYDSIDIYSGDLDRRWHVFFLQIFFRNNLKYNISVLYNIFTYTRLYYHRIPSMYLM